MPARSHLQTWVLFAGLGAVAVVLYAYDPSQAGFFPRCPVRSLTGWRCPGCGAQRALHALAHLEIARAWGLNPLLLAALPYVGVGLLAERYARVSRRWARFRKTLYGVPAAWISLLVVVCYAVARNL